MFQEKDILNPAGSIFNSNNATFFDVMRNTKKESDNSHEDFEMNANCEQNDQNEYDVYANIFSSNLEDCLEFTENNGRCEEEDEMIREAMNLPEEQRKRRMEEIQQHIRFLQRKEAQKRIITQKNHRPFDDANIGLCLQCFDDNFKELFPFGSQYACKECLSNEMEQK